jgi:formylglycine-generating enzyme required for sulfatase activity
MTPDDLVLIPGGSFLMGQHDGREEERPVHQVSVAPFRLCRIQTTNEDFDAFRTLTFEEARKPVNWGAVEFRLWLGGKWGVALRQ